VALSSDYIVFADESGDIHPDREAGKTEDKQLQVAFSRICEGESLRGASKELSLELLDKKANLAGLQIADLVGTPLGWHLLRPDVQNRAFESIRAKLHTLITLP
jgi:hypothetical protein